jgi:hypothetical protein
MCRSLSRSLVKGMMATVGGTAALTTKTMRMATFSSREDRIRMGPREEEVVYGKSYQSTFQVLLPAYPLISIRAGMKMPSILHVAGRAGKKEPHGHGGIAK